MKVGFIGVGKLGCDAAEVMSEHYDVLGYDIRPVKTSIPMTDDLRDIVSQDIVFVAVPTPHDPKYDGRSPTTALPVKDFEYSIVKRVLQNIKSAITNLQNDGRNVDPLVVLISTVLPGTIRAHLLDIIDNMRFVYNPYLIAQGTVKYDMKYPEMMMLGTKYGDETADRTILENFYKPIVAEGTRFEFGTWEEIEAMKIFYNTFITAKLCLVNTIQDVAERVGNMNVDVVANALRDSTMRIMGPQYMKPGLGDGGACHPRDNIALSSMAERLDLGYDLFGDLMYTREQQARNIAQIFKKIDVPLNTLVVVLGTGFKPAVTQLQGSPALLVAHYLIEMGYTVAYDQDHLDEDMPKAYLIGHMNRFVEYPFTPGSWVVDPWRQIPDDKSRNLKVYRYGDTRKRSGN